MAEQGSNTTIRGLEKTYLFRGRPVEMAQLGNGRSEARHLPVQPLVDMHTVRSILGHKFASLF